MVLDSERNSGERTSGLAVSYTASGFDAAEGLTGRVAADGLTALAYIFQAGGKWNPSGYLLPTIAGPSEVVSKPPTCCTALRTRRYRPSVGLWPWF